MAMESSTTVSSTEPTATTGSADVPLTTKETELASDMKCIPNITLQQDLLSKIKLCDGCSAHVALDGNHAVAKYGDTIYFYSKNEGGWKMLPIAYRGASSSIGLALSDNFTVVSDFTTDDLNRNVFVIEKDSEDIKGVWNLDWRTHQDTVEAGFGHSIDIKRNLMVIGAPGSASIYQFLDDDWHLYTCLNETDSGNDFAESVAVAEGRVAVTGFNAKGQAAVFVYEKNPPLHFENYEEIIIDHCEDGCDDVGVSLSFSDDNSLMIGYPRKNTIFYFVLSDGKYVLDQELSLPAGFLPDQVVVSGSIAFASARVRSSLLLLVKSSDHWSIATTIEYSSEFSAAALSGRDLMVSVGHEVLWYALDGCDL
eukprot:93859_1